MTEMLTGVPAEELRAAARLYATGGNGAIYYGLGVTEHSQGSTTVMGIANLAMLTGNIGRDGVGVNPLRGQNNVQGSCDMGSFPHELPGYRHVKNADVRAIFEKRLGRGDRPRAGPADSQHAGRRRGGAPSRGSTARARISCSPTPTRSMSPPVSPRWTASSSTTCS
jgi:anaerobic selenocysteine-containing dehydrogenase